MEHHVNGGTSGFIVSALSPVFPQITDLPGRYSPGRPFTEPVLARRADSAPRSHADLRSRLEEVCSLYAPVGQLPLD